ncbi:hypothetical protein PTTG_08719 [Puccinia triticina 1-1 BBBD Race 1]|uniref:Uncharacterized protein n=2 Tax=Puccinia triticina TaxID=208348 RepID=A0A180G4B5_PUCT1|nr:uncharacterized protein PtA15_4A667 [Puccinia triticina]OAV87282.1 hypothetical protein PTTG_08719 [Puccinia triticina 1-1 BBBD Race 1]WAQ84215.1 hypothetical protein PtA15_4A667 [Puccinia triticina]WAR55042.1 hypothetical protein PtB15_4B661 [Puccinia triticina]
MNPAPVAISPAEALPNLKMYKSPVKGKLTEWAVAKGQVLHKRDGWRTRPIVKIKEPCTHAVQ